MEKGRIFEPRYIRNQMVMGKFVMLKMFLSAVAAGMFGMSLLAMISGTHRQFMSTCTGYYNHLNGKGVLSSIVGGSLLGVGMSLSGSCPTSVFCQLGAMLPNAGYTFLGGLAGTVTFGILQPLISKLFRPAIQESSNPWHNSPYFVLALPLVGMFGILVCAFEILWPWTGDVQVKIHDASWYETKAWPPYVSGILIGLLQIPLIVSIGETLGGSSSLLTMVSQVFVGPLKKLSPFIAKYRTGFGSWWQIFYVAGVVSGAYFSAYLSDSVGVSKGVPVNYALAGGFLIFFGARIAGGCTSGHGLSGMGFLSILSFITVASMFFGAIPTAFLMKSRGVLRVV